MNHKKDEVSNFINYSDKVFIVSQADRVVSHDIPFENSYSGVLYLTIKAISPIFIRNHYVDGDSYYEDKDKHKISHEFCHHNNTPYIPATSIKGMIRNTLEILSYSKLKGKTLDKYLDEKITDKNSLHHSDDMDLSELIFGTIEIKGRVNFSHFKAISNIEYDDLKKEILMTPEAKKKKFGWKNYPQKTAISQSKKGNNDDVVSEFKPLKKGVIFEGKVRFNNVRDYEIGAILSAITFHNTPNTFHALGVAKSLGYGRISINVEYDKKLQLLQAFEEKMNSELFGGKVLWHKSDYVKEILLKHSKNSVEPEPLSDKEKLSKLIEDKKLAQIEEDEHLKKKY